MDAYTEAESEFSPCGYYQITNTGGYLVEISECGSMARFADSYSQDEGHEEVSDWVEITEEPNPDWDGYNEEFISAIPNGNGFIPLNMVMRIN